jgi:hypothetical protein
MGELEIQNSQASLPLSLIEEALPLGVDFVFLGGFLLGQIDFGGVG